MIAVLLILFTPFIDNLDNEDYYKREFCSNILSSIRPLSDIAIYFNYPKSSESQKRIDSILNKGYYAYIKYNISMYIDFHNMLYYDYPDWDELPWLPDKIQKKYNKLEYFNIFKYHIKNIYGLDWYIPEPLDFFYGLNDLRFHIRGLPIPTYGFNGKDVQKLWKERKDNWRNK